MTVLVPVNDLIYDRAIRHAVYLERFKAGETHRIVGFLNDEVYPDLLERIAIRLARSAARGLDTGLHTTQRLRDLSDIIKVVLSDGFVKARNRLTDNLIEFATSEAKWNLSLLTHALPVDLEVVMPSAGLLRSIVTARPMQGKILRDWFTDLDLSTRTKVRQAINIGLGQGEATDQIVRRLQGTRQARFSDGVLEQSRRATESVVRTAVTHTTAHAAEQTYVDNSDIVDRVRLVATLDSRTTIICINYDGKTYPVGEGPRPPFHYGCRTRTVPVVKSWAQLGINLKEAPPGTRASMNGQVPDNLTYPEWLKKQSVEVQNEVLGKGKAELWRRGKVTIDKFMDARDRPLTLKELNALEADIAKKR